MVQKLNWYKYKIVRIIKLTKNLWFHQIDQISWILNILNIQVCTRDQDGTITVRERFRIVLCLWIVRHLWCTYISFLFAFNFGVHTYSHEKRGKKIIKTSRLGYPSTINPIVTCRRLIAVFRYRLTHNGAKWFLEFFLNFYTVIIMFRSLHFLFVVLVTFGNKVTKVFVDFMSFW